MLIDKVGHIFLFLISKLCLPGSLFLFKEQFDTFNTFKIMYQNDTLCVFFIRKKNDITLGDQVSSQKERQLCLYFSSPRRECQRLGRQPNGVIWLLKSYSFFNAHLFWHDANFMYERTAFSVCKHRRPVFVNLNFETFICIQPNTVHPPCS